MFVDFEWTAKGGECAAQLKLNENRTVAPTT
jgi:hypothetical protein